MSAASLRAILAKGAMVSDNLRDAAALCDQWYAAEPSLATFVLRGVFADLTARGWDAQQGAPSTH